MLTAKIEISKNILEWVLRTSEGSLNEKWTDNVKQWINGDKNPTVNQISQLSKASKIPFGYLFLQEPPKVDLPLLNFRTVNNDAVEEPSKELLDTVYEMQSKVSWLSDYRKDQGMDKISFIGMNNEYKQLDGSEKAERILNYFDLDSDWNFKKGKTFNILRERVTNYGITVSVNGVVRNTRRRLNQNEFRAFVIIDDFAPLIFINSRDSFNARLFSLVHELVHIWYGQPELYNFNFQSNPQYNDSVSEQEINLITENIILPKSSFLKHWNKLDKDDFDKIKRISRNFDVSSLVVAIRAKHLNLISQNIVDHIKKESERKYDELRKKNKANESGPNFYDNLAYKTDVNFARDVIRSAKSGETSYTDAFDLLNVRGTAGLKKLSEKIGEGM